MGILVGFLLILGTIAIMKGEDFKTSRKPFFVLAGLCIAVEVIGWFVDWM